MKIQLDLRKITQNAYFLSILLVSLPPFYLLFSFLNIHSLAKIIWLLLFLYLAHRFYQKKTAHGVNSTLIFLFALFFISQSASIISAINANAFLQKYEDFFFSALFFLISLFFIDSHRSVRKIIYILIGAVFVNALFQGIIFFNPDFFLNIGRSFLHEGYLEIININIQRSRVYSEVYDEVLVPIIISLWVGGAGKKAILLPSLLLISFFSFVSNFRTRFLMLALSFMGTFIVFIKEFKKYFLAIGIVLVLFYFLYSAVFSRLGFTVIERMLLEDRGEDVVTVTSRISNWVKSVEIGLSAPILGVGLGNYYEYLDFPMKQVLTSLEFVKRENELASFYPHNIFFEIFAESGFLGLFSFILLLSYFVKKDLSLIIEGNPLGKAFVISFWVLIGHALFNPASTVKYLVYFWLLRVIIEKAEMLGDYSRRLTKNSSKV